MFSCLPISTLFPYTTLFRSGYIHLQLLPPFRSFQMHVEFRASCLFRLHSCDLEAGIPPQDHMNEVEKDMMPEILHAFETNGMEAAIEGVYNQIGRASCRERV